MSADAADEAWNQRGPVASPDQIGMLMAALPDAIEIFRTLKTAEGRRYIQLATHIERDLIHPIRESLETIRQQEIKK